MAYKLITDCPVCGDKLKAIRLTCSSCGTSIESEFSLSKFEQLTGDQLQFVEIFIKSRGSIKDVEKELVISYPTVMARLNDVIASLGYAIVEDRADELKNIIDRVESGELSPDEAVKKIKSK